MAGYGYKGYSSYDTPRSSDWSTASYGSDHVCWPVIIDANGRKRPIVAFTPTNGNTESYVTKAEMLGQQHIHSPLASEYKCGTYNGDGLAQDYYDDRPAQVESFISRVQTEASRPKFGPVGATYWRQSPNNEFQKPGGNTHRNDNYDDYSTKYGSMDPVMTTNGGWGRPNQTAWSAPSDTILSRPSSETYRTSAMEPTMMTNGGWARPSHTGWSTPPNGSLSEPTSNINKAMEYLIDVAKSTEYPDNPAKSYVSSGPQSRYGESSYKETIDSREAARRYGKFNLTPRPYTEDNYTSTIDSREAARRYNGTAV